MRTIHTILREDFGRLDRDFVRKELLLECGVHAVSLESARNELLIEYDPLVIDDEHLTLILCRHGLLPGSAPPRREDGGDG